MPDSALTTAQLADNPVGLWVLSEAVGATTATNRGSAGSAMNATIGSTVTMGATGVVAGTTSAYFTEDDSNPNPGVSPSNSTSFAAVIKTPRDSGNAHGLQPSGDFTIECAIAWDLNNSFEDGSLSFLTYGWSSEGSPVSVPYSLFIDGSASPGGLLAFGVNASGTQRVTTSFNPYSPYSAATPFHIAARYSGSTGAAAVFVNGVNVGSGTLGHPITYVDTNPTYSVANPGLIIGGGWKVFNGTIYGWMSNVAVYNTALSDTRIQAHASAMSGGSGSAGSTRNMPSNPNPNSITGSVEIDLSWGSDFQITDSGDLLLAADTPVGPNATIERLQRLVMTTPTSVDPNTGTPLQADDIFNPTWGAGARAYVGDAINVRMIQSLRARVINALVRDPGVSPNPPPVVSVAIAGAYTALLSIQFTSAQGQATALQLQLDSSGVTLLPQSPS